MLLMLSVLITPLLIFGAPSQPGNLLQSTGSDSLFTAQKTIIQSQLPEPNNVIATDVNNDGKQDLVTSSFNTLYWYQNTSGDFGDLIKIDRPPNGILNLVSTDFNDDGFPEFFATTDSGSVIGYTNEQGQSFQQITLDGDENLNAYSLKTGDVDHDGKTDLIATLNPYNSNASYGASIVWYQQLQNGVSEWKVMVDSLQRYLSSLPIDMDSDGDLDLIVSTIDSVRWFENTPSGFSSSHHIPNLDQTVYGMHACDMDDDGDSDLIVARGDGKIVLYRHNIDGFGTGQIIGSSQNFSIINLQTDDIDQDGDLDVITSTGINEVSWYEQTSLGFSKHVISDSVDLIVDVTVADFNNDQYPDVVNASNKLDNLVLYMNQEGSFGSSTMVDNHPTLADPTDVNTVDVDNDGALDIIASSMQGRKISWYPNTESGFGPQRIIRQNDGVGTIFDLEDFNNDGKQDILAADLNNYRLLWYPHNQNGYDSAITIDTLKDFISHIEAADLNDDDLPDLLVTTSKYIYTYQAMSLFQSNSVVFTSKEKIAGDENNSHYFHISRATDINQDGKTDIVVGGTSEFGWFINTGSGYKKYYTRIDGTSFLDMELADLDGDQDPDLVYAYSDDNGLSILIEEDTTGGYQQQQWALKDAAKYSYASDIEVADLDNDNRPDILVKTKADINYGRKSKFNHSIFWLKNTESGFTAPKVITTEFEGKGKVHTADIDRDGDLDIISINTELSELNWYENTLLGTAISQQDHSQPSHFTLRQNYPNPFNPTTTISYQVPRTSNVVLKVYNLTGRLVQTLVQSRQQQGRYSVQFDASGLASGVYLYRLNAGDYTKVKQMMLIK